MSNEILEVQGLEKQFNGIRALANFSGNLHRGKILGLIGPNGSGKTTLFNVVSGFIVPDSGKVFLKGKDITGDFPYRIANQGISRTFQSLRLIRQVSVLDNVLLSFQAQLGEKLWNIFFKWRKSLKKERANRKVAFDLLEEAGLLHKAGDLAGELSYGQQKLLTLVCCLATKSEVLLLDEPVAGIAPEMIEKILGIIQGLPSKGKSVILIEHNLDAVLQVCDRVIFMETGAKISEGSPEEVRNDSRVIDTYID